MSKRVVAFIIALILAIITSYCAELNLPAMPQPPAMTEAAAINNSIQLETTQLPAPQQQTPLPANEPPLLPEPPKEEHQPQTPMEGQTETGNINIGLSKQVRQKVVTLLNKLLADEYVLYTKTLKYHWNVQGIVFHDFHALFKEEYEMLFEIVDKVAERARALGAPTLGSLHDFSAYTRLKEVNGTNLNPREMITNLLADHEMIIRTLRADIATITELDDQGTSNFLQDIILKHEKIAWMLRSTLAH